MSTPSTQPNQSVRDPQRRGRMQEGAAIGLALLVLVATFVVASTSVVGETVSPTSRTDRATGLTLFEREHERCEHPITIVVVASDGSAATDHVCSFGRPLATTTSG